jgi:hypothetical protein
VRIGRQHVRDGIATIRTEKTGTEVHLPILPELQEAIAHGPTADLAFVCGANGKPMTKESFDNAFSEACRAAGVNKSAHGCGGNPRKRNENRRFFSMVGGDGLEPPTSCV